MSHFDIGLRSEALPQRGRPPGIKLHGNDFRAGCCQTRCHVAGAGADLQYHLTWLQTHGFHNAMRY
jgi:hypothetical protein